MPAIATPCATAIHPPLLPAIAIRSRPARKGDKKATSSQFKGRRYDNSKGVAELGTFTAATVAAAVRGSKDESKVTSSREVRVALSIFGGLLFGR